MFMPNASPNVRRPNTTYIPPALWVRIGVTNFRFGIGGDANFRVFRYQHVGKILALGNTPNARGLRCSGI